MIKTISETQGTIGSKKLGKNPKNTLDEDVKLALQSAANLLKDLMRSPSPGNLKLCVDLKRKLEDIEKVYGINLI